MFPTSKKLQTEELVQLLAESTKLLQKRLYNLNLSQQQRAEITTRQKEIALRTEQLRVELKLTTNDVQEIFARQVNASEDAYWGGEAPKLNLYNK